MITYNDGTTTHSLNLERSRTDVRKFGNLASLNAELLLDLNGESSASFDIRGTFVATIVVEGTDDGVNWISMPFYNSLTEIFSTNISVSGSYDIPFVSALRAIRIRCLAFTSGLIATSLNASLGISMIIAKPVPTLFSIGTTAAINIGTTTTLSAPGVGLYHYITRIRISKYIGATLTPGSLPAIVTTTNLNGNPSFDFKTLGSLGDSEVMDIDFTGNPLKSSNVNLSTNFACPAITGVIWKATIFYYTGA